MNYQTKLDIEFENSNQWREIKFLWVDPFQNLTTPINLPLRDKLLQKYIMYSVTNFDHPL